eukprot:812830-Pelagomonas_calceolata.AAC.1
MLFCIHRHTIQHSTAQRNAACAHLEEVQKVGHGGQQDGAGHADGVGQLVLLLIQHRLQQHLCRGKAAVEGRAHLMAHETHKLALGFIGSLCKR